MHIDCHCFFFFCGGCLVPPSDPLFTPCTGILMAVLDVDPDVTAGSTELLSPFTVLSVDERFVSAVVVSFDVSASVTGSSGSFLICTEERSMFAKVRMMIEMEYSIAEHNVM